MFKATRSMSPEMVVCKLAKLVFLFTIFCAAQAHGQTLDLSKPIRVSSKSMSLDSVLKVVSKQADVVFSYNSKKLNTKSSINLSSTVFTLAQLLSLLEKKDIKIKIIENYIVLSYLSTEQPVSPSKKTSQNNLTKFTEAAQIKKTENKLNKSEPAENNLKESLYFQKRLPDSVALSRLLVDVIPLKLKGKPTIPKKKLPPKSLVQPKIKKTTRYFDLGLTTDETTPLGAATQFGFPFLYAAFSVNTSFESTHFRYGLGTRINLKNNLSLLIISSYGDVQRSGQFTDTTATSHPLSVKSKLWRVSMLMEFKLNQQLKMQVGPMFNYLETHYFIDSKPSNLLLFNNNGDNLFYAIRPRYLLSNTFSPTKDSNIKTWLGLQVNLFYTINFKRNK